MNVNYSLANRSVEGKVEEALIAEAKRMGVKPNKLSEADIDRVCRGVLENLTENELRASGISGLQFIASQVIGEKIAAEIWNSGIGMDATHDQVMAAGRKLRVAEADIEPCYFAFMEGIGDMQKAKAMEFPTLAKFEPLFEGEAEDAPLGAIAERKAAVGNKLAMSFLAWKEIA